MIPIHVFSHAIPLPGGIGMMVRLQSQTCGSAEDRLYIYFLLGLSHLLYLMFRNCCIDWNLKSPALALCHAVLIIVACCGAPPRHLYSNWLPARALESAEHADLHDGLPAIIEA